ncbi:DUF6476 family protein [Pseudogemmobacter faecipullorum]|uniref:Uncharacterized protein n=1 Tax=Pseudogemmobacter faecipullorum TaxID=2755041 RepID=A0ABS8CNY8_9RHOB|nr:DUF6476 family protein [Pseudogemmobacter faecipullorum]MCB5410540.1 hypothetical protein [Pseudogemmobacter faecipullorum]
MAEVPEDMALPPSLRFLKGLVIVLMLSMIAGVIAVTVLLVTRLNAPGTALPELPAALRLPEGEKAGAVTFGKGWTAVVTESGRLLIFDATGALKQDLQPGL